MFYPYIEKAEQAVSIIIPDIFGFMLIFSRYTFCRGCGVFLHGFMICGLRQVVAPDNLQKGVQKSLLAAPRVYKVNGIPYFQTEGKVPCRLL